jgi:hypothetical protein
MKGATGDKRPSVQISVQPKKTKSEEDAQQRARLGNAWQTMSEAPTKIPPSSGGTGSEASSFGAPFASALKEEEAKKAWLARQGKPMGSARASNDGMRRSR